MLTTRRIYADYPHGTRLGDAAPMAILELVDFQESVGESVTDQEQ
jgi:hypothetical protein